MNGTGRTAILAKVNDPPAGKWRRRGRVLAVSSLAILAGCAGGDVVLEKPGPGYVRDIAAKTANVDWSKAETVTVTLSEFRFAPARLNFQSGVPYRLRLRNAGTRDHTFTSPGFFRAIAAEKLVAADGEIARPYLQSIAVPPGAEKELFFVPVKTAVYDVKCTVILHESFGMEGKISVR